MCTHQGRAEDVFMKHIVTPVLTITSVLTITLVLLINCASGISIKAVILQIRTKQPGELI